MEDLLLEIYRRTYHKATKAHNKVMTAGSFGLQMQGDGSQGSLAVHYPPDRSNMDKLTQFLRPFLTLLWRDPPRERGYQSERHPCPGTSAHPAPLVKTEHAKAVLSRDEALYYQTFWTRLKEKYGSILPAELIAVVEATVVDLGQGIYPMGISMTIAGVQYGEEDIYRLIADGEYHSQNPDAVVVLKKLDADPGLAAVSRWVFAQFHSKAMTLASLLLDCVLHIEASAEYKDLIAQEPVFPRHCIFCKSITAEFTTIEHIFPEALGNRYIVMPRGPVCDICNNDALSKIDNAFVSCTPISLLNIMAGLANKEGKLPGGKFQNLELQRSAPATLQVTSKDPEAFVVHPDQGDGHYRFTVTTKSGPVNPRALGRGLFKIALEAMALTFGVDYVLQSRFDQARNYVLSCATFDNNILIQRHSKPGIGFDVRFAPDAPGAMVYICIHGTDFILNLKENPPLREAEHEGEAQFMIVPLLQVVPAKKKSRSRRKRVRNS